jgi:hypothetical protein
MISIADTPIVIRNLLDLFPTGIESEMIAFLIGSL